MKKTNRQLTRRAALQKGGIAATGTLIAGSMVNVVADGAHSAELPTNGAHERLQPAPSIDEKKVRYCINTSTIRGQNLGIVKEIELAAKVGYNGIEPWIRELDDYKKAGGSLKDLGKRMADLGLTVDSAIGFANWIVDDDEKRKRGLEQAKRDMDIVAQVGGEFIAAPPAGATGQDDMNLFKAARRFGDLVKVGREIGVLPQVEVWGFSKCLSRLGECIFVAIESGCEDACILPDIYHIYKGGSDYAGLGLLSGDAIQCFHMNDFPAEPPREKIGDADRVYPGDGVAPTNQNSEVHFCQWVFRGTFIGTFQ